MTNGIRQHQASGCYGALYIHVYFTGQENHATSPQVITVEKDNFFSVNNKRGWKGRRGMIQYYTLPQRGNLRLK